MNLRRLQMMSESELRNSIITKDSAYHEITTTLTEISSKVIEQKFYEISISNYVDVEVGKGAFMQELLHNAVVDVAGSFESGSMGTADGARQDTADVVIAPKTFPIINWAKSAKYSLFDIRQCMAALNFDLIEAKTKARKKNWDLGIQETVMLGSQVNHKVTGVCNSSDVAVSQTLFTKPISAMTAEEFQSFVSAILGDYYANTNSTTMPNRFYIPASDYSGLGASSSAEFPLNSKLHYLKKAFEEILAGYGITDFQILPLAYLDKTKLSSLRGINKNRYVLLNKNPETLYAPIPVDFTMTQFGTYDNFNFINTAFGQYAGTVILRPQELKYYDID